MRIKFKLLQTGYNVSVSLIASSDIIVVDMLCSVGGAKVQWVLVCVCAVTRCTHPLISGGGAAELDQRAETSSDGFLLSSQT